MKAKYWRLFLASSLAHPLIGMNNKPISKSMERTQSRNGALVFPMQGQSVRQTRLKLEVKE